MSSSYKLGFDNIYIYDKNNNSTDYIGDFIDNFIEEEIKMKVYILKINDKKLQQ